MHIYLAFFMSQLLPNRAGTIKLIDKHESELIPESLKSPKVKKKGKAVFGLRKSSHYIPVGHPTTYPTTDHQRFTMKK